MSKGECGADLNLEIETVAFEPNRQAGLDRLAKVIPRMGTYYAQNRNFDFGKENRSSVSALSPWIRHRLITEEEVLADTLAQHSLPASMKFIQEVFWRGYFKGWLEQHPSVWQSYQTGVATAFENLNINPSIKVDYDEAIAGRTGIACFDHWSRELKETGYLHNHARMWFASIWIFTLRLPWELGANFFLRNLLDGDPASNTLSWRWVGGLHTKGKIYLADSSNIAQFTDGRFEPTGQMALEAEPLSEDIDHPFVPFSPPNPVHADGALLLITPEDCLPETLIDGRFSGALGMATRDQNSETTIVQSFSKSAVTDAISRSGYFGSPVVCSENWAEEIIKAAENAGTNHVITPWAPLGETATQLDTAKDTLSKVGIRLDQQQRPYDALTWPHASKGFFKLKKKIPQILSELRIA